MLIELLITLIIVGAILYLAKFLPIDPVIKQIITVIAIVAVVIWLLRNYAPALGIGG